MVSLLDRQQNMQHRHDLERTDQDLSAAVGSARPAVINMAPTYLRLAAVSESTTTWACSDPATTLIV